MGLQVQKYTTHHKCFKKSTINTKNIEKSNSTWNELITNNWFWAYSIFGVICAKFTYLFIKINLPLIA